MTTACATEKKETTDTLQATSTTSGATRTRVRPAELHALYPSLEVAELIKLVEVEVRLAGIPHEWVPGSTVVDFAPSAYNSLTHSTVQEVVSIVEHVYRNRVEKNIAQVVRLSIDVTSDIAYLYVAMPPSQIAGQPSVERHASVGAEPAQHPSSSSSPPSDTTPSLSSEISTAPPDAQATTAAAARNMKRIDLFYPWLTEEHRAKVESLENLLAHIPALRDVAAHPIARDIVTLRDWARCSSVPDRNYTHNALLSAEGLSASTVVKQIENAIDGVRATGNSGSICSVFMTLAQLAGDGDHFVLYYRIASWSRAAPLPSSSSLTRVESGPLSAPAEQDDYDVAVLYPWLTAIEMVTVSRIEAALKGAEVPHVWVSTDETFDWKYDTSIGGDSAKAIRQTYMEKTIDHECHIVQTLHKGVTGVISLYYDAVAVVPRA